jgi:hypothetical protein
VITTKHICHPRDLDAVIVLERLTRRTLFLKNVRGAGEAGGIHET